MASVVNDPIGRKRILFVGLDRVRRAIRLGRCDYGQAVSFCRHVESLLMVNILGEAFNPITATSLSRLSPKLRQPLAVVGLVEPEKQLSTGESLGQTVNELTRLHGYAIGGPQALRRSDGRGVRTGSDLGAGG